MSAKRAIQQLLNTGWHYEIDRARVSTDAVDYVRRLEDYIDWMDELRKLVASNEEAEQELIPAAGQLERWLKSLC